MGHLSLGVEETVVHVDVEHHGPVAHLLAGYGQCLVILLFLDEPQKLATAGHVAAFAHVDKGAGQRTESVETGEPAGPGLCVGGGQGACLATLCHTGYGAYVVGRGTAASADDVHRAVVHKASHRLCHTLGCFGVAAFLVGQSGVGVCTDAAGCLSRQLAQVGTHIGRTEGAVEPHAEEVGTVGHGGKEGIERLAGQRSS